MTASEGAFYRGKNVLVAGGGGMIGQSLVAKLLDLGAHVRATQFKARKLGIQHKNLEVVSCDLRDEAQAPAVFKDMDMVFLAAAKVGGAKLIKEDPSSLIIYNLSLHANLMYLAAKNKLQRCAFVSSSYVYPDTGKPNVEAEGFVGDPWIPLNYGLGWIKRYLETLCKHFQLTSQTKFSIVRPTNIYGPHDSFNPEFSHVVPATIVKAVARTDPFEVWGTGDDIRSFTYVDDLTDGILLATERHAVAEGINICPSETNTVKDVVRLCLEHVGYNPKVVFNSTKPSMIPYKASDPGQALELLGWKAKVGLKEGLKRTIDWYVKTEHAAAAPL